MKAFAAFFQGAEHSVPYTVRDLTDGWIVQCSGERCDIQTSQPAKTTASTQDLGLGFLQSPSTVRNDH